MARPDHVLPTWCAHLPRKGVPPEAWDVVEVLLLGLPVDEETAAALGEAVSRLEEAVGRAVCARVAASAWGIPAFFQVLHLSLLYAGHTDWAGEVRRIHAVDVARPNPWRAGPWTTTPLAAAMWRTREEMGRPRRLKRAVDLVRELLAAGADPRVAQQACPLVFWAAARQLPWAAVVPLLEAGVDPMARLVLDRSGDPDPGRGVLSDLWEGATLAHLLARTGNLEGLRDVLARAPRALEARDGEGLTPLLRAAVPVEVTFGAGASGALWPTLELLLAAGADPGARTRRGNSLAHVLALACEHRAGPSDIGEVLLGMGTRDPGWLDRTDAKGRTGWEALGAQPVIAQHPAFQALVRQRALDQALDGGGPASRRGERL